MKLFPFIVDSGGQYKDGTTDVTRTLHFGTPKPFEKECFTRVLKGQLKVAMAIFPTKIKGNYLDTLARVSLWEVGLDYNHGKYLQVVKLLLILCYYCSLNNNYPFKETQLKDYTQAWGRGAAHPPSFTLWGKFLPLIFVITQSLAQEPKTFNNILGKKLVPKMH